MSLRSAALRGIAMAQPGAAPEIIAAAHREDAIGIALAAAFRRDAG